jgi:hypothetical protein
VGDDCESGAETFAGAVNVRAHRVERDAEDFGDVVVGQYFLVVKAR